jgi:multisubunit Na+/H+ antiporter MnhB subunit
MKIRTNRFDRKTMPRQLGTKLQFALLISVIILVVLLSAYMLFNPDSALDFVMKLNYSIKTSAHGLFLNEETKFNEYQNKYKPMR